MRAFSFAIASGLCATSLAQTVLSIPSSSKSSIPVISAAPSISGGCATNCSFQELLFTSSSWSKWITPVTVGTAFVVIDRGTNKTTTTTKFNSATKQFLINGTLSVLGATVTQTATIKQLSAPDVTITWPTPYLGAYGFQIDGTLQYTSSGVAKCTSWPEDPGIIPVPAHNAAAFPKATPQPFDKDDPYGQTYTLVDVGFGAVISLQNVATAFPGNPWILAAYQSCSTQTAAAPLQAVSSVGALIATSTQVISASPSSTTSSTTSVPQPQSAVLPPSTSTPVVPPSSSAQAPSPNPPPQSSAPAQSSTQAPPIQNPAPQSSSQPPPAAPAPQSSTTQAPPVQNPVPAPRSSSTSSSCDAACLIFAGISGQITTTTTPVAASSAAVFSVGGQVLSQGASSQVVVGSQTLRPGSVITQSGTTFSLAPSGNAIIVNGASIISAGIIPSTPQPITVTVNSQSQLVVGSQTVAPTASTVTIGGTTYSVGGTGATRTLVPASTSSTPAQYKGAASRQSSSWLAAWLALSLAIFI